jgi:nitroimidazol reductase NimA-like FMN-containing flavoprotein (pyridoxamine 5'-phosphate oxidase superfamily)
MRRKEREITSSDEIRAILSRERVVRVAFAVGGEPYIVPLSYGYDPARHELYLHTACTGRKIDFIERNPRVCLEIEGASSVRRADTACSWGLSYESLIGYGVVSEIVDAEEKARALACLMRQQSQTEKPWVFSPSDVKAVRVWRLTLETVTGKRSN